MKKSKKDIARIKSEQRRRELVKMAAQPDAALDAAIAVASAKVEAAAPGKRRALRTYQRLTVIQTVRAIKLASNPTPATAAAIPATTGKGK